jgi:hypothetical protein
MCSIHRAFVDRLMSKRLGLIVRLHWTHALFDLWRVLANKLYSFNTHIEGDVKDTTQKAEMSLA